jgi:hypothetical protein
VSMTSTGLECFENKHQPPSDLDTATCQGSPVIAPGGSIPIMLTVTPHLSGTVTNMVNLISTQAGETSGNTASDPTIVVAAVPTLPQWAMMALAVLLVSAGVAALRRRTT